MRVMIQWHTFFSNLPLAVDQSPISTEFAASFLGDSIERETRIFIYLQNKFPRELRNSLKKQNQQLQSNPLAANPGDMLDLVNSFAGEHRITSRRS